MQVKAAASYTVARYFVLTREIPKNNTLWRLGDTYQSMSLTIQERPHKITISRARHTRSGQKSHKVWRKQLLLQHFPWPGRSEPFTPTQTQKAGDAAPQSLTPPSHHASASCIPPALPALPLPSQPQESLRTAEPQVSVPGLTSREAAPWLGNGKGETAPQAEPWNSPQQAGRYLGLRHQGLSQKIHIYVYVYICIYIYIHTHTQRAM